MMENEFGFVYVIETAQQFWSELEDILTFPSDNSSTLQQLDSALKTFLGVCASYHEQYLQSPFQLQHACDMLLASELFQFHSDRMCDILEEEAKTNHNPHTQLILYNIYMAFGHAHAKFFRSQKRWKLLLPLLMDHILIDIDPDVADAYLGLGLLASSAGGSISIPAVPIPVEVKLRSLAMRLVYEVCRVQKFSAQDLKMFNDTFIDHLFDLVEQTRDMQDETFNYSIIKLIVALNEQFMVASLQKGGPDPAPAVHSTTIDSKNRVLVVLIRRLNMSQTFGSNMIFMLNRAKRTDDSSEQLLVLKMLFLLFTTQGTSEYFYTNDLCVLVDVFLRELVDLDEESESLRHTYLRVLHPLLTKTQLRNVPYKQHQIVLALESLIDNTNIRDINPTTKRLVERCLSGDWCAHLRKKPSPQSSGEDIVTHHASASPTTPVLPSRPSSEGKVDKPILPRKRSLRASRSAGKLRGSISTSSASGAGTTIAPHKSSPTNSTVDSLRKNSDASVTSLPSVVTATAVATANTRKNSTVASSMPASPLQDDEHRIATASASTRTRPEPPPRARRSGSLEVAMGELSLGNGGHQHHQPSHPQPRLAAVASSSLAAPGDVPPRAASASPARTKRIPPAPPVSKKRKPPAVPVTVGTTHGGATITAIASSSNKPWPTAV